MQSDKDETGGYERMIAFWISESQIDSLKKAASRSYACNLLINNILGDVMPQVVGNVEDDDEIIVKRKNILEKLAALEHEQWASWRTTMQAELIDTGTIQPSQYLLTKYEDLPEIVKEEDREYARKVLELMK
jgi:hypothetical protein